VLVSEYTGAAKLTQSMLDSSPAPVFEPSKQQPHLVTSDINF
jgi:hypothetical protein